MAPRGRRPRKKDNARMDAAIETMQMEYGITDAELIKKIVNQLLSVYGGGEEAWYFIEHYTYLELFEGIIRYRQENPGETNYSGGGDFDKDNSLNVATAENHAPENAGRASSEPICSEVADRGLAKYQGRKDIGLDLSSSQIDSRNAVPDTEENSGSNEDSNTGSTSYAARLIPTTPIGSSVASRPVTTPLLLSPCLTTADGAPPRRHRRPCYGWIENDDEEDIDGFINLKPAKATATRRSRWDLRPSDP